LAAAAREWLTRRRELTADVLFELKTRDNELSVYALDQGRDTAVRVVAAIGSMSSELVYTDCLVFDSDIVSALGIPITKSPGLTPDRIANDWHFDLAEISAGRLTSLAEQLVLQAQFLPLLQDDLVASLRSSAVAGDLDLTRVNKKVRQQTGV
jgi:hypothetical protein